MAENKKVKYTYLSDRTLRRLVCNLAIAYAPEIYRCKRCGYPVISGYCCTHCGDSDPSSNEEGEGI